jgi:hypothetical protein
MEPSESVRIMAEQLAKKNVTPEVVFGYEMLQTAVASLLLNANESEAKNYVAISMMGVSAPFDRAEIHLIRPGGLSPHDLRMEAQREIGGLTVKVLQHQRCIEDRERGLRQRDEKNAKLVAQLARYEAVVQAAQAWYQHSSAGYSDADLNDIRWALDALKEQP